MTKRKEERSLNELEGNEDVFDCVLSDRANFSKKMEDSLVMGVTME